METFSVLPNDALLCFLFSKLRGCSEPNNTTHIARRLTHIVSPHSFQAAEVRVRHVQRDPRVNFRGTKLQMCSVRYYSSDEVDRKYLPH